MLDKGFVCNPQLGCGLVAGLGPSGRLRTRPGFGWFFGGDAFMNMSAMTAYGDFETVRAEPPNSSWSVNATTAR